MENSAPRNPIVPFLVVLLIVASFLLGSLYTKVNLLEKGTTASNSQGGQVAGAGNAGNAGNNSPPSQPQKPSGPVDVSVKGAPRPLGNQNAKVALVEFTDYQCPFCGRQFTSTFPSIKKDYIDTGKVKYFVRDFPLRSIHQQAQKAAEAVQCANEQGKFWEYHDKLFANQQTLDVENLKKYAQEFGLVTDQFNSCLDSGKYTKLIDESLKDGESYGVQGTPATFIGTYKDDTVSGFEVSGAQPYAEFQRLIDQALAES